MAIIRQLRLLTAILVTFLASSTAESPTFGSSVTKDLKNQFVDNTFDAHADFVDFDHDNFDGDRRLQSGGSSGSSSGGSSSSTTERCNFWCQLKNSMAQTIIGLLLICVSPCLMWKNEGRHVTELRRIDFCRNNAVVIDNVELPSDDQLGQLVHFTGNVTVDDNAIELSSGSALNLTSPLGKALVVKRTCMIYQKFEHAEQHVKNDVVGGGTTTTTTYTVKEDWSPMGPGPETLPHLPNEHNSRGIWDELIAASGSEVEAGPVTNGMPTEIMALLAAANPAKAPNGISVSPAAHVGGFGLSKDVIMEHPLVFLAEWTPVPSDYVPDVVEGLPELRKDRYGNLTTVEEGEQPTNGDVMIKYEYAGDGFDASFVVEQILLDSDPETGVPMHKYGVSKAPIIDDKCCGRIHDDLGVIWMVRRGTHDLKEMIDMAKQDEATLTKILRIVCLVLIIIGWTMLFSIFSTLLHTLPLLGQLGDFAIFLVALILGCVCFCSVTAVAYIRYRPLLAFGILALAAAITGICFWRLGDAAEASIQPTMQPVASPKYLFFDDAVVPDLEPEHISVEYY
ncbi:hypothetical protein ACHAWX_002209 [Stephanocyclus meneghinianus]